MEFRYRNADRSDSRFRENDKNSTSFPRRRESSRTSTSFPRRRESSRTSTSFPRRRESSRLKRHSFFFLLFSLLLLLINCKNQTTQSQPFNLLQSWLDQSYRYAEKLNIDLPSRNLVENDIFLLRKRLAAKPITAIAEWISNEAKIEAIKDPKQADSKHYLLPTILKDKKANCLGLVLLSLSLNHDENLHGVLLPDHLFLRQVDADKKSYMNYETLRGFKIRTDAFYRDYYHVDSKHPLYFTNLSRKEVFALLNYNLANDLRAKHQFKAAIDLYHLTIKTIPKFAQAYANLGLSYQRIGQKEKAIEYYGKAKNVDPSIQGIEENLKLMLSFPR